MVVRGLCEDVRSTTGVPLGSRAQEYLLAQSGHGPANPGD